MGLKSNIERAIQRARRAGDEDQAAEFEQILRELKDARGDAAYARAQLPRNYQVKKDETFASIAESELGDPELMGLLMLANPGLEKLSPGALLRLPEEQREAFEQLRDIEGKAAFWTQAKPAVLKELMAEPEPVEAEQEEIVVEDVVAMLQKLGLAVPVEGATTVTAPGVGTTAPSSSPPIASSGGIGDDKLIKAAQVASAQRKKQTENQDSLQPVTQIPTATPGPLTSTLEPIATPTPAEVATPYAIGTLVPTPVVTGYEGIEFGPERDYVFTPQGAPEGFYVGYTVDDFIEMNPEQRMNWIYVFSNTFALDRRNKGWFNNFWATVAIFKDSSLFQGFEDPGNPASQWISVSDAFVFESVQNGWLLSQGYELPEPPPLTSATIEVIREDGSIERLNFQEERVRVAGIWAEFFMQLPNGNESELGRKWGASELPTVQLAAAYADQQLGKLPPEIKEKVDFFVDLGDIYRTALREGVSERFIENALPELAGTLEESGLELAMELHNMPPWLSAIASNELFQQTAAKGVEFATAAAILLSPQLWPSIRGFSSAFFEPTTIVEFDLSKVPDADDTFLYGPTYAMGMLMEKLYDDPRTKDMALDLLDSMQDTLEDMTR
jgi:hypothetical protein